jgi:hypothetical protein
METLIIEGNSEQIGALKAFLKAVGMTFKTEIDATDYLLSNSANKTELLESIKEARTEKPEKLTSMIYGNRVHRKSGIATCLLETDRKSTDAEEDSGTVRIDCGFAFCWDWKA